MAQTTGVIDDEGMVITLPETALAVAPPTSTASSWIDLERDGQPTTCYATRSTGVAIMLSPTTGESTTDIFDCGRGPFVIGVPYGPFSVEAVLLGNHDITIGTSPRLMVPATRGTSSVEVVIAAD